HASALPYCFMAALGSAIGGLVPFYLGRAGGELFLMKRVNRQRYEQLRDRFESQEFFAILVPSFLPPPMPVKLFLFAAGVFEMKTIWFFIAVFTGKFVRFLIWALITIFYGPAIVHEIYAHPGYVLAVIGIILGLVIFYAVRKLRGRRDSESPAEDRTPDN
ncbi:MAG: VTT domain-containing protein, partial [Acidobacteriaceae bacterium]|nr:VTT domain-containing protein [Acidobacteriaceae bacterium]